MSNRRCPKSKWWSRGFHDYVQQPGSERVFVAICSRCGARYEHVWGTGPRGDLFGVTSDD